MLRFGPVTWICLGLGLLPLAVFDRSYRSRYFCFCIFMSGVGGLLYLLGEYINCSVDVAQCFVAYERSRLQVAIPAYIILALLGGIFLRRQALVKKKQ